MENYLKEELYGLIMREESFLAIIQESAWDGLWYLDLENRENEWMNAQFWNILGYDPREMPHFLSVWKDFVNKDDIANIMEKLGQHPENSQSPFNLIVGFRHKNGSDVQFHCRGQVICNASGKPIRVVGVYQYLNNMQRLQSAAESTLTTEKVAGNDKWDILNKRKFENDLILAKERAEESEYKFKASFFTSPDSISITKMNGEFVEINDGFCSLSGYSRDEVIGKNAIEIGIWAYSDEREKWVEKLQQDGVVQNFQTAFRTKHGEIVPGLISSKIIRLKNEPHTLSVTRDIADRIKYEEQLIKAKEEAEKSEYKLRIQNQEVELNNERLESLLRISQFQTNSIQELLDYALDEAIKLTGSKIGYIYFYDETKKQFILNTWSKDVMKQCAVQNPQQVYDLDKTGCWGEVVRQRKSIMINDYQAENPHKKGTPEGHVKLEKFLSIPVIIDGRIVAVAGVANKGSDYNNSDIRQLTLLMDNVWKISERLTLIENLRIAKEKAEESDRLKTAFLQNMSHEIRTPMNAIMGFSELLSINYSNDPQLSRFTSIINQRCNDLLVIIDDILDIAKIESGQYPLKIERCNLVALFREITLFFKELQVKMAKEHIQLKLEVKCCTSEFYIETDAVKLKQILINLIGNAFKFTDTGSIEVVCKLDQDNKLLFFVSDTGMGIPREKFQEIFKRFSQLEHSKNRTYGGTGLGLSIVKGLVELLGGSIYVESEVGKGAIFYFSLPHNPLNANENIPLSFREENV